MSGSCVSRCSPACTAPAVCLPWATAVGGYACGTTCQSGFTNVAPDACRPLPTPTTVDGVTFQELKNYTWLGGPNSPGIYGHQSPRVWSFSGSRIAMVVDIEGVWKDFTPTNMSAMSRCVSNVEAMLRVFDDVVGKVPPPIILDGNPLNGKTAYEVAWLVNAAGRAWHGSAGMMTGDERGDKD